MLGDKAMLGEWQIVQDGWNVVERTWSGKIGRTSISAAVTVGQGHSKYLQDDQPDCVTQPLNPSHEGRGTAIGTTIKS